MMLLVYGVALTLLLWSGSIFEPLRVLMWRGRLAPHNRATCLWRRLWGCPMCLGVWVGWFVLLAPPDVVELLGTGALVALVAWNLRRFTPRAQPDA